MNAWPYIDATRRSKLSMINQEVPRSVLAEAVVVAFTPEARALIANVADGLPADAVEFPEADVSHWPWKDRPVLLVPPEPFDCRYVIRMINGEFLDEPRIDTQSVLGTLINPPGYVWFQMHQNLIDGAVTDVEKVWRGSKDWNEECAQYSLAMGTMIDAHPDSTTDGTLQWGQTVERPDDEAFLSEMLIRINALVRGVMLDRFMIEPIAGVTRPQSKALQREGVTDLYSIRPIRIGDRRESLTPAVLRHREHYTAEGWVKAGLTKRRAAALVALKPELASYTCRFCGALHVGNRRRRTDNVGLVAL